MFNFRLLQMNTVIISSGSFLLLAIGSLLLAINTVHTLSNHQTGPNHELENYQDNITELLDVSNEKIIPKPEHNKTSNDEAPLKVTDNSRRRSGRLYGSSSGQQSSPLESYAAAYAAANSVPSPGSSSSSPAGQSSESTDDASSYNSFGEQASSISSASNVGLPTRQLGSTDYALPHSNYYASYMSPSLTATSYSGSSSSPYSSYHANHHNPYQYHQHIKSSPISSYSSANSNRYTASPATSYYDRAYLDASPWSSSAFPSTSSSGLMSSASSALSHWTGGFGISEIICAVVAIAIGAVILGAPFFLIYLALMGNFSGSGTLSLTNPASTNTANTVTPAPAGRKKRLAIFEQQLPIKRNSDFGKIAENLYEHLNPLIDFDQISSTFKRLVNSVEKFAQMKPEENKKSY